MARKIAPGRYVPKNALVVWQLGGVRKRVLTAFDEGYDYAMLSEHLGTQLDFFRRHAASPSDLGVLRGLYQELQEVTKDFPDTHEDVENMGKIIGALPQK